MSRPGWYPDPSGLPRSHRFWDGSGWTGFTTDDPDAPPPVRVSPPAPPAHPSQRRGPLLAVAVGLATLLVAVVVIVRTDRTPLTAPPASVGSAVDPCPAYPSAIDGPTDRPPDGRVHGGALSFPELGAPWSGPQTDDRVPFGRDVHAQSVELERSPTVTWYASVLVAELDAGRGFVSPQTGAQLVTRCLIESFYGGADVRRDDTLNEAQRVDGRDAWRVESQLHFVVPGISVTQELMIVVVVDVGGGKAGLCYASVPATAPEFLGPVRATVAGLTVD